jgi:hypothetical protein
MYISDTPIYRTKCTRSFMMMNDVDDHDDDGDDGNGNEILTMDRLMTPMMVVLRLLGVKMMMMLR